MHHRRRKPDPGRGAFTLIELLVVVAIIALLISILLPGLRSARESTRTVVCLSNLRSLGQGFITYSVDQKTLPGPLHPAVYRNQGIDVYLDQGIAQATAKYYQSRQITFMLRSIFNDQTTREDGLTDKVSTCPTLAGLVSDSDFNQWKQAENKTLAFPMHYALNNWGGADADPVGFGNARQTDPGFYFGFSPNSPNDASQRLLANRNPPRAIESIRRASEEWAIADAWYRERVGSQALYQQEGPYQSEWSGVFLPYYAPHKTPFGQYSYTNKATRTQIIAQLRSSSDGQYDQDARTNAVYFDGHGDSTASRRCTVPGFGNATILYGFRGTINPKGGENPNVLWE